MKKINFHTSDIEVFIAVARSGSLVGAARKLRINHSTAFRWLKRLEGQVGQPLFERTDNHYVLTESGHSIWPVAVDIENNLLALSLQVTGREDSLFGDVRITSADALVLGYLPKKLCQFSCQYPGIKVNLSSANDFADLSRREADIAIRPTIKPEGNMIGRKAAVMGFGLYASNSYIESTNVSLDSHRFEGHRLCNYDESLAHLKAAQWIKANMSLADTVVELSSTVVATNFAKSGMGLAVIPCFLAEREHDLKQVLYLGDEVKSDIWVLTHPDLRHSPKIRAALDFIFDEIKKDETFFNGRLK
ncbi:MAG: LysR family transcriptional regulator [Cellvibrionaceae bacterium]